MSNLPIDNIVIHTSATEYTKDISREDIDSWHRNRGWRMIGYHYVIRRDGTVQVGRQEREQGAHVYGYNRHSVGICMIGGLTNGKPTDNYTVEQYSTLKKLVADILERYPKATVKGHRDYSPDLDGDGIIEEFEWTKVCPCFAVADWMKVNFPE